MLLLMFILWIIFNGRMTAEIALIGLAMTAAVYWFACRYLHYSLEMEKRFFRRLPRLLGYYFLLVWEIVKANWALIRILLHPGEKVHPVLTSFEGKCASQWGRAALADSITLTPGTITVSLEDNRYIVHCLDERFASGLENSIFEQRILAIEEVGSHD